MLRFIARRIVAGILVLFAITYVAFFTQDISARQKALRPAPLADVAKGAWSNSLTMWKGIAKGDLGQYLVQPNWNDPSNLEPTINLIEQASAKSAVLLGLSMLLGGIVGGLLGIGAAAFRRKGASMSALLLSIVGVSTPSFFLAVLLQFGVVEFYKATGTRLLPAGGFGYDLHLVLPVLVLSARPIAQVARLTSGYMDNLIHEDFVRTARSKGLVSWRVWFGHIVPNAAGTILTAMASSLRFSLSSLPLVETYFSWRGLGFYLLQRIEAYDVSTTAALVLATGFFFVLANGLVDFLYRILDPRLRNAETVASAQMETGNWLEMAWSGFVRTVTLGGFRERRRNRQEIAPLPVDKRVVDESEAEMSRLARSMRWGRLRAWRRATVGNPALAVGAVLGIGLLVVVVAGPRLAPHNPYTTLTRVEVNGVMQAPPAPPSSIYPLGTDPQGRDILSLLLTGASRTIVLAAVAVIGRLVIGGVFGFLAGWFHNSLLDRALMALGELVNSFPALLLATLVVYAVGVRQGMYAFVIGLLVISWPEVMQNVRAQVMAVRPMAYIEGAVATGAGQGQILTRHVLPGIWPTVVSLAFLEMGGALMILGELGFLGVFIGGGLAAEGEAKPLLVYYDVPEWGVMMAHSWASFRSYPWTMIYPALAFMVAIVTFTLLGEGLRRMAEELTLSMKALFNRYSLLAVAAVAVVVWLGFRGLDFWAQNKPIADTFDAQRALADVETLSSPDFQGRQIGTPGAEAAADWIAQQFRSLGLITCGENFTYFQTVSTTVSVETALPDLKAWDSDGNAIPLEWGQDYAQAAAAPDRVAKVAEGDIVYAAAVNAESLDVGGIRSALGISDQEASRSDKILLVDHADAWVPVGMYRFWFSSPVVPVAAQAILVIADDPETLLRRELPGVSLGVDTSVPSDPPVFYVSAQAADKLLAGSGYTLAELRQRRATLSAGEGFYIPTGARAELAFSTVVTQDATYRNVIGVWPGEDTVLDSDMIIITAYYDGLGQVDGVLYPGANDNASGVATMLEMIRSWKESGFKPKRTVLFVAWAGGERYEMPDVSKFLSAQIGMDQLNTLAVFEVEGVGAGEGDAPLLWRSTSQRVSGMVQTAAQRLGLPLSVTGGGLHAEHLPRTQSDTGFARLNLGWPGGSVNTHVPTDTADKLDPVKIKRVGQILSLVTAVMATDPTY